MLYLISGTSRSGKTIIARQLLAKHRLPYLSLDWLMMGFNDGIPEYGIHHLLWPHEIARRMWPFLSSMIENMIFDGMDYVIEGEAMLPELIAGLVEKHPDKVKVVFLGYAGIHVKTKVALVKKYSAGENDWLTKESDDYVNDHIGNMVGYSKMIEEECVKHRLPYVDTSRDFSGAIAKATDYLIADADQLN